MLCLTAIDDAGPQLASRHGVVRRQVHESSGHTYHRMLSAMLSESPQPCIPPHNDLITLAPNMFLMPCSLKLAVQLRLSTDSTQFNAAP